MNEAALEAAAQAMCDRVNGQGDYAENIGQRRTGWLAQARAGVVAYLAALATPTPPVDEPWPGYTADQDRRRVETLAKLGLMLSVMAGGEAPEVTGFDAADLYGEVLMALAIEDAEDEDIALQDALDDPEGHMLIGVTKPPVDEALREAAEKPLNRDDLYRFMGTLKLSEKRDVAEAIGFDAAYVAGESDMDRWKRMWLWAAGNDKKPALATAIRNLTGDGAGA